MNAPVKFNVQEEQQVFYRTLKKRVNDYFHKHNISKFGNTKMYLKTGIMYALYILPFIAILTTKLPLWSLFLLYTIMGIGVVGIGMAVMHDAIHGSYSSKPRINKVIGFSMNAIGSHWLNWKIQHNVIHHTYTNIPGVDNDISNKPILRFEPMTKWKPIHRFQHIYAFFLYTLSSLNWTISGDFKNLKRYNKEGFVKQTGNTIQAEWRSLLLSKFLYFSLLLLLPISLGLSWWLALFGFTWMHMVSGLIMSVVFQLAHVVESTENPLPDADGYLENTWAVHQLHTTANFAKNNHLLSWFVGGLNYQIEHHLFPHVCHVHYPEISKIVKTTAEEYQLPYLEYKTFRDAFISHYHSLKELGQKPVLA